MPLRTLKAAQLVPVSGGMYVLTECGRVFFQAFAIHTSLNEAPLGDRWFPVSMPAVDIPDPPAPPPPPPPPSLQPSRIVTDSGIPRRPPVENADHEPWTISIPIPFLRRR